MQNSITIKKLIENLHIHTTNLSDTKEKIKQMVTTALLEAVSTVTPVVSLQEIPWQLRYPYYLHSKPVRSSPVRKLRNIPNRVLYKIRKALQILNYLQDDYVNTYYASVLRTENGSLLPHQRTRIRRLAHLQCRWLKYLC